MSVIDLKFQYQQVSKVIWQKAASPPLAAANAFVCCVRYPRANNVQRPQRKMQAAIRRYATFPRSPWPTLQRDGTSPTQKVPLHTDVISIYLHGFLCSHGSTPQLASLSVQPFLHILRLCPTVTHIDAHTDTQNICCLLL